MRTLVLALTVAAAACAQPAQPPEAERHDDGVVTITVKDGKGKPLPGAWVLLESYRSTVSPAPERVRRHAATDAAGRVRFSGLPNGSYSKQVQVAGGQIRQMVPPAHLQGPKAELELELVVRRSPVVTGRVLDEAGVPLVRANVDAFRQPVSEGEADLRLLERATTDDRGIYRMSFHEPGAYFLMASHSERTFPYGSAPRSTGVAFYPNALDLTSAAPVHLDFDQPEHTLDLTLPTAPDTSLTAAIVSGPDGKPCAQCSYTLQKVENGLSYQIASSGMRRDPGLSYQGIPVGAYRILVQDQGANPGWWAISEVAVVEGRPAETLIATQPPITVSGRVVLVDPPARLPQLPRAGSPIRVALIPESSGSAGRWMSRGQSSVPLDLDDRDFRFESLPPGRYRFQVNLGGGIGYLAGVSRQGRPIENITLDLSQPGPWDGLELEIRFDLAQLSAQIDDPGAEPGLQYLVVAAPKAGVSPSGSYYSAAQCPAQGRCSFPPQAPGSYRVVAITGAQYTQLHSFRDSSFLEKLDAWVRPITLAPDEQATIRLTPAPAGALDQ